MKRPASASLARILGLTIACFGVGRIESSREMTMMARVISPIFSAL